MRHMPTLKEVMTPFPQVAEQELSVAAAIELMESKGVHHIPVVEQHEVVGLLSGADIKLAQMPGHPSTEYTELTVGDICRRQVFLVDLHSRLDLVLQQMADEDWDAAVVLKDGHLAGVFTVHDACRSFAHWLQKEFIPDDDPSVA